MESSRGLHELPRINSLQTITMEIATLIVAIILHILIVSTRAKQVPLSPILIDRHFHIVVAQIMELILIFNEGYTLWQI
jgi:hypothetical protein